MIVVIRESASDTLAGSIDGVNATYRTTYAMDPAFVALYVNGRLKAPSLDDGYALADAQTVVLALPPRPGDTVEVEYQLAGAIGGGGAPGGLPRPPAAQLVVPSMASLPLRPKVRAGG